MALKQRLAPVLDQDMSDEQKEITRHFRRGGVLPNVIRVGLRHLKLFKAYKPFSIFTLALSELDPRIRELAILRVAWNNHSDYEWAHHVRIAQQQTNLSEEEIARVASAELDSDWPRLDAAVLSLVDQLRQQSNCNDATFDFLMEALGEQHLTELLYTIGNYDMLAKVLNVFGVPLEEEFEAFKNNTES